MRNIIKNTNKLYELMSSLINLNCVLITILNKTQQKTLFFGVFLHCVLSCDDFINNRFVFYSVGSSDSEVQPDGSVLKKPLHFVNSLILL